VPVEYLIESDRAALGTLRRDLAAMYAHWMNRVEVRRGLAHLGVFDVGAEEAWLADASKASAERRPAQVSFTVFDRRDGEAVGPPRCSTSTTTTCGRSSGSCWASAAGRGSAPRPRA